MSLVAFAEARGRLQGRACWVCELPQVQEINAAWAGGVRAKAIVEWLDEEHGVKEPACYSRLVNHFTRGHNKATVIHKAK